MKQLFGDDGTQSLTYGINFYQLMHRQNQALAKLSKNIAGWNERIDTIYVAIEKQEAKIKDLILNGKKAEAKRQLRVFKVLENQLTKSENILAVFVNAKVQLESRFSEENIIKVLELPINFSSN